LINGLVEEKVFQDLKTDAQIEMLFPLKMAKDELIPLAKSLPLIHEFNLRLAIAAARAIDQGEFPVSIGGDHSNAVGMWNGVRRALSKKTCLPLGLIWIDAHMDGHVPETTPSGAWHGMPAANLLGYGEPCLAQLTQKEPVLLPENLVYIGVRSFEEGEAALLKKLNVKIYFIDEVKERGLETVVKEAIARAAARTGGFGVSLDIDVIDPEEAPGVGSPEPGGIAAKELISTLPFLMKDSRLVGFEMVEYNPERDIQNKTRNLIFDLLRKVL
jgi:arginase